MFKSIQIPEELSSWLRDERDYCYSSVAYGDTLQKVWRDAAKIVEGREDLTKRYERLSEDGRDYIAPVVSSLDRSEDGIPGYQGVIERSLRLTQNADHEQYGNHLEKVVVVTLPTNYRYAAVYEPFIKRDWKVIAIDWGFICGLWGLSVCFSSVVPTSRDKNESATLNFDAERLAEAVKRDEASLTKKFVEMILPCIMMGNNPPISLLLEEDKSKILATGMLFNSLVFSVTAHEYAHLRRDHLAEKGASIERRHQMEFEADSLSLVYALTNPWRTMLSDEDSNMSILSVAAQSLLLFFVQMLEMGDHMLSDLGCLRSVAKTHPPAMKRLLSSQYILNKVLQIDDRTRDVLNKYREGLTVFGNTLWNASVGELVEEMRRRLPAHQTSEGTDPRGAELMFL